MCRAAPAAILLALAACSSSAPTAIADAGAISAEQLARLDGKDPKQLLAVVDQMAAQLKDKPKTFEVLAALGNLYYENARYLDAVDSYRQALARAAPVEAEVAAWKKAGIKPAAELPAECRRNGPGYGLEQIAAVARRYPPSDRAKALRCDLDALELALAARARRGNALYLVGMPDQALAEHQRVLDRDPDSPESLFFVGAMLLEKSRTDHAYRAQGEAMWRHLLAVAPEHPRAALVKENLPKLDTLFAPRDGGAQPLPPGAPEAEAGADATAQQAAQAGQGTLPPGHPAIGASAAAQTGQGELPPGHPAIGGAAQAAPETTSGPTPEQVKNLAEAAQNTERTPELEKSLDESLARGEALLDQGNYAEARSALVQVMPMRPDDPRVAAAMGGVMRGMGKLPMAERVLGRALQLDPRSARANYELGLVLAAKGDKLGATERLELAQSADPAFARQHHVADELAKIR